MANKSVYTVAQINSYIKNMFTQDYLLRNLCVKGEVSNCKYHTSGHIYFTLKDAKGTLSCVMFAGFRKGLKFRMEEGQQVLVSGTVDVYERDGKYQLYAREIELSGAGALYERYEQLKRELAERGMFAEQYKQPIPRYIHTLGVVTAPTGAAVRDIIQIVKRRNPYVQIILYPALVQGEGAAPSIVNGIRALEQMGVDVMIVGRGGGSIEDLWAFNEEIVAQAVFDCTVPVISAVGHETDTTIIDYVADLRAPTPSAAAELAVAEITRLFSELQDYVIRLNGAMENKLGAERMRTEWYGMRFKLLSPESQIREKRMTAIRLMETMQETMQKRLLFDRHKVALYAERLKGLSPLDKLSQGFSYVADVSGKTVTDVGQVETGDALCIQVKNGRIFTQVTGKEAENP
ncbi:MAG: exodeoxyribonuclease VII large subunit [Clostridiales bacterium]|nr:exodeoxyribonuclease VII large subunit [Clostridiales bacterium]